MLASTGVVCKDCKAEGIVTRRKIALGKDGKPVPGPRCTTHYRAMKRRRSARAHELRTEATFGLSSKQYWAIYAAQGHRCAICRVASGRKKRLAVDHDHDTGEIRGLLCQPCNYTLLGRYGIEALQRAIDYLENPPARKILQL